MAEANRRLLSTRIATAHREFDTTLIVILQLPIRLLGDVQASAPARIYCCADRPSRTTAPAVLARRQRCRLPPPERAVYHSVTRSVWEVNERPAIGANHCTAVLSCQALSHAQ